MKEQIWDFIKETISIIVIAFILAMILRTFVIEGRIFYRFNVAYYPIAG